MHVYAVMSYEIKIRQKSIYNCSYMQHMHRYMYLPATASAVNSNVNLNHADASKNSCGDSILAHVMRYY